MKKYIKPALCLLAIIIIGGQIYFDLQLRKTNALIVAHIQILENFIQDQFSTQVANFNDKQTKK